MIDFLFKNSYNINDLIEIVRILRSENGCPWDREQDHHSVRYEFLEETCEVLEAIDKEDAELLREELGDVLLQVVFHAQMENEKGSFDFDDVANDICKKLIVRHPHVFGEVKVENSEEVLKNWDNIKQKTKGQETYTETLTSVASTYPALIRAQKVTKRAKRAGMDFRTAEDAMERLESEVGELREVMDNTDKEKITDELGDLLFSCVNVARHLGVNSEEALTLACDKFIRRFAAVEEMVRLDGLDMPTLSIETLDTYWDKAKTSK